MAIEKTWFFFNELESYLKGSTRITRTGLKESNSQIINFLKIQLYIYIYILKHYTNVLWMNCFSSCLLIHFLITYF